MRKKFMTKIVFFSLLLGNMSLLSGQSPFQNSLSFGINIGEPIGFSSKNQFQQISHSESLLE